MEIMNYAQVYISQNIKILSSEIPLDSWLTLINVYEVKTVTNN